jgi:hypothetical protein
LKKLKTLHFFLPPIQARQLFTSLFSFFLSARRKLDKKKTRLRLASEREIGSRRSEFQAKRSILFLCLRVRKNRVRGDFFLLVQEAPPFEVEDFLGGWEKETKSKQKHLSNE